MSSASLVKNQTIEIIKIIRKHISVFIKKLQFSSIWEKDKQIKKDFFTRFNRFFEIHKRMWKKNDTDLK